MPAKVKHPDHEQLKKEFTENYLKALLKKVDMTPEDVTRIVEDTFGAAFGMGYEQAAQKYYWSGLEDGGKATYDDEQIRELFLRRWHDDRGLVKFSTAGWTDNLKGRVTP